MLITVEHSISMGHRLQSYDGVCSSAHGHNIRVTVDVDPRGEFVDFKKVHRALEQLLEPLDHAMVLESTDPLIPELQKLGLRIKVFDGEPTTEALAKWILRILSMLYEVQSVTVHETDKYSATATPEDLT